MLTRYSSRRAPLHTLLPDLLAGAVRYDRIAGYFSSSILEVAGEALERMPEGACARVVCNSELHPLDVASARAAKLGMTREWRRSLPEDIDPAFKARLGRLADFLGSGRLQVKVLSDETLGLVHGKAGVIRYPDGAAVAFIGSANESRRAWTMNYEIVWTDASAESVAWTQEEFEALWRHPQAVALADAVVTDIQRLTRRVVVPDLETWHETGDDADAAAAIELPIYRREDGLWAHQKWFVRHAFELHKTDGARLVLADQVGLGKTVQLALAAKLMALWGGGQVLALVPKTLMLQWRDELLHLLGIPSATWTSRGWEDERGVLHPANGLEGLRKCPRRFGIVSTGLVRRTAEARDILAARRYETVILDEAHHARRKNLGRTHRHEAAEPNNLLRFLRRVAGQTKSLLLATATPVQIDPIEAWDLLDALNIGNGRVLGGPWSRWQTQERRALDLVLGREWPPADLKDLWEWVRDPLPPDDESHEIRVIRQALRLDPRSAYARPEDLGRLRPSERDRLRKLGSDFFQSHNPFIRHIVRRTRDFLETTIGPDTNEPYLKPVRVELYGEREDDAVRLPSSLHDAYIAAEDFCEEVGKRPRLNSGFLKTLLLRRVGSTVIAGRKTAEKMLGTVPEDDDEAEDEDPEDQPQSSSLSSLYPLSDEEERKLRQFLRLLDAAGGHDPKYEAVARILRSGVEGSGPWLDEGCIIFSQYLDSAEWVARRLSAEFPHLDVALYAGGSASGVVRNGQFTRLNRDGIKERVRDGEIRLLIGTDAASEGLNLQRLGTLINLDLPWNPTRLEQRKGRIQRIGQTRETVRVYNLRYRGSVEDRVHQLLSARLEAIRDLFGQLPDTLEDVWVSVALRDEEKARQVIDQVPRQHPFEMKYDRIADVDWESCAVVLDSQAQIDALMRPWT